MNKKLQKAARLAGRLAHRIDFRKDFHGALYYGNAYWWECDHRYPIGKEGWFLHIEYPNACDQLSSGDSLVEFLRKFPYKDRVVFAGKRYSRRYSRQRDIKIHRKPYLLPAELEEE